MVVKLSRVQPLHNKLQNSSSFLLSVDVGLIVVK